MFVYLETLDSGGRAIRCQLPAQQSCALYRAKQVQSPKTECPKSVSCFDFGHLRILMFGLTVSVNQERIARLFDARRTVIQLVRVKENFDQASLRPSGPESRPRRAGLRHVFAGRGATGALRRSGRRRSSPTIQRLASSVRRTSRPRRRERAVHLLDLQLHDLQQLVIDQLIENDDLVQTIDKFRVERLAHARHDHLFHLLARRVAVA